MPKVSNKIDYTITPISFYKFVCKYENVESSYVGSTANFRSRKANHKSVCNNPLNKSYNSKIYQTIREQGGWECWTMIQISSQLCESKRHAERIEQELITELKANMNSQKAFGRVDRTPYMLSYNKQYRLEHDEKIKAYNKQYYLEHANELNAKSKIKRQAKIKE